MYVEHQIELPTLTVGAIAFGLLALSPQPIPAEPESANPTVAIESPSPRSNEMRFVDRLLPMKKADKKRPASIPFMGKREKRTMVPPPPTIVIKRRTPMNANGETRPPQDFATACPAGMHQNVQKTPSLTSQSTTRWLLPAKQITTAQDTPKDSAAPLAQRSMVAISTSEHRQPLDNTLYRIDNETQLTMLPHSNNITQTVDNLNTALRTPTPDSQMVGDQLDFLEAEMNLLRKQKENLSIESWIQLDVILNKLNQGVDFVRRGINASQHDDAMIRLGMERIQTSKTALNNFVTN